MSASALNVCWAALSGWHAAVALLALVGVWWLLDVLYRFATVSPDGKVVFVTGAGTGIGEQLVHHLHSRGVLVVAGCLLDSEVERLNAAWKPADGKAARSVAVRLDVTSDASVAAALRVVTDVSGGLGLHAIVNNAGILDGLCTELTPMSVYEKVMAVNYFGLIRVCKAFIPLLRASRGRIINCSSIAGLYGAPNNGAYHSSKYAVEGFSDGLRMEMAAWGITVCLIEPGTTATPILESVLRQPRRCFDASPAELRALYGTSYIESLEAIYVMGPRVSQRPQRVVDAYHHALFGVRVRDRYAVGADAQVFRNLLHVPAWLSDPIVRLMLWAPTPAALKKRPAA